MSTTRRVSGLSDAHAAEARRIILAGTRLLLAHFRAVHYTQDAVQRWEGITKRLRIAEGEWPRHGDCSSTHSWLLWNALTHVGARVDHLNGLRWQAGYTETIAAHGKRVHDVRNMKVGDAVLYSVPGSPHRHVATAIGGGLVFSHGGEAGPFKLGVDYRPDRAEIRRHL
jgi:hypothetical protein